MSEKAKIPLKDHWFWGSIIDNKEHTLKLFLLQFLLIFLG